MNIAVIGCGEVGRCYIEAMAAAGHRLSLCEARPGPAAIALAADLGQPIHDAPGAWLADCQLVVSAVFGQSALSVARSAFPHVAHGATYADLTTASPSDKIEAAHGAACVGVSYADVAIMGAISLGRATTPLLLAGPGADATAAVFADFGAKIRIVPAGVPGQAIAIKFLRSIYTKGIEALAVECLISAQHQGVVEELMVNLQDIDEYSVRDYLSMLVRTHVVHANRRKHEVEEAQRQLTLMRLPAVVTAGVHRRFVATTEGLASAPGVAPDPTFEEALSWLVQDAVQSAAVAKGE